jgi:hypothetical protein
MATVTPNFNWPVPTSTDLVKDGATAIEALGDSIDASLVDLKGGTSGQVLSKNSNTDMDFVWVTSDDANAIQNTIVDAKGDLIAASAADTPARLAVGNNGETLVADSSTSTGLRYQNFKTVNYCLNSNTSIWQRGTSISAAGAVVYGADRFAFYRQALGTGATVSRQAASLTGFEYSMRLQRDSGNANTELIVASQVLESSQSSPLAGKAVTISFWAKAGANLSSTSSTMSAVVSTGTGTNQSPNSLRAGSWTSQSSPINSSVTITTTWARYQLTATLASDITQAAVRLGFTPTGTAGANDWIEITGIQLEVGSIATAFQTATGTIQGELSACMRYFQKSYAQDVVAPTNVTAPGLVCFGVYSMSNADNAGSYTLPVPMRVSPTVTTYSFTTSQIGRASRESDGTDLAAASANVTQINQNRFTLINQSGGAITPTNGYCFHFKAEAEL